MLAYITWNVNPEIFTTSFISPRWYGLLFAAGFYLGFLIMQKIFNLEKIKLDLLDKLTWYMVAGTVIGARLGHVFFYGPYFGDNGYLSNPLSILKIWEGGLASHGAAIGILVSLFLYIKFSGIQKNYLWVVDRIVIVVALAGCLIRLGNLMNHEIVGTPTDLPWAFVFMGHPSFNYPDMIPRHPAQLYESFCYLLIFIGLAAIYKKYKEKTPSGLLLGVFLSTVFTARFFIEFVKEVQVDFEKSLSLNMGQYLSIPFVAIGIVLIILALKRKDPNQQSIAQ